MYHHTKKDSFINLEGKMFILVRFSYNIADKVRNDFFVWAIPENCFRLLVFLLTVHVYIAECIYRSGLQVLGKLKL